MPDEERKQFQLGAPEPSDRPRIESASEPLPNRSERPESVDPAPHLSSLDVDRLGAHLALALQEGAYHPVIIFGTAYSGKTSLLLSLLSTLISEPRLATGLSLCDPILGTQTEIGKYLHDEARRLFEVKTQAFIEGEKIPATNLNLPFFVPVEIRPAGKATMRFAFLESNGEWYRPLREKNQPIADSERLYPQLRTEIEDFISHYQGGISFIYLIPYTQREVFAERDEADDADQLNSASIAIMGVLRAYDRIRANHRADDRHLMLVSKWDARSTRDPDRAEGIEEDHAALSEFCTRKYHQAIATFQGLNLEPDQRGLNAYCSGIINKNGLLQLRHEEVRDVVLSYPIRLWKWLYKNGLEAAGYPEVPLFPQAPAPPMLIRAWRRFLDFISG